MGAAMAPAAADTIKRYLEDTKTTPEQYDLIVTGDLGQVGSTLLVQLLQLDKIDISQRHKDCGLLLYDQRPRMFMQGLRLWMQCRCIVFPFLKRIAAGQIARYSICCNGSSDVHRYQPTRESIPGIAHLVHLSSHKGKERENRCYWIV